jgi:hypothetical protein
MDIRWAAVIFLGGIYAGRADAAEKIQVDVYVQPNNWPQPLGFSERLASEIFGGIDVRVAWHAGELPAIAYAGRFAIGIRLMDRAPVSLTSHALASARPYSSSGSLISVYEDRGQQLLNSLASLSRVLLAYVFAHELAHVMEGADHDSDSGVMKANWSNADHAAMLVERLGFTDSDSDRIRSGLAVMRTSR